MTAPLHGPNKSPISISHKMPIDFDVRLPDSQHSGNLLTATEVDEKKQLGLQGVSSLEKRLALASSPTLGIELEFVVTDMNFDPAPEKGREILNALKSLPKAELEEQFGASVTGELYKYQQEINPVPRRAEGDSYYQYEQNVRKYLEYANEIAQDSGCHVLMHGILPTQTPVNVRDSSLSDNPRYPALVSGVETARAMRTDLITAQDEVVANSFGASGPSYNTIVDVTRSKKDGQKEEWATRVVFKDQITDELKCLRIQNTSVLLAGVMTSMQSHIAIPRQEQYVGYHRAADLVTPLIAALTVGEPLLFMQQAGAKGLRNFLIWQSATEPQRVAYTADKWLESPLGQLREAQHFGPIFGRSAGKLSTDCPFTEEEATAIETAKTVWNINRTTLDVQNGAVEVRIENRVAPCGPTVTDTMADVVVSNALIRMGYQVLKKALGDDVTPSSASQQQMHDYMDFSHVRENMRHACVAGLEAQVLWAKPGDAPRHYPVLKVLEEQFLPGLVDALCLPNEDFDNCTLNREDVEHYIKVIRDRLTFKWSEIQGIPESWKDKVGCTSADVILYLDHRLKTQFPDSIQRARKLVMLLKNAASFDQAAFDRSEKATGQGRGAAITEWMRTKFAKKARAATSQAPQVGDAETARAPF